MLRARRADDLLTMKPMRSGLSVPLLLALAPAFASAQPPSTGALEEEFRNLPLFSTVPSGTSELERALAARDYERAERLLADAIAREPTSRSLLMQIASVFMMDRKPLNAAIAIKKAEVLGPLENDARLQLALAYVAMKRGDWARPELERLASAEPDRVTYPYWLARLDYDDGQYALAAQRLERVVEKSPTFARAHDNLGLCYEALNQPDNAILHYREAVRLNRLERKTPSAWPALNLGILLRTQGELDEAESLFREALKYDAQFARAHYQLGVVLEQRGRMDESVNALRRATTADAALAEPYYALSRIYRRLGRAADADAALATFQRLHEAQKTPQPSPQDTLASKTTLEQIAGLLKQHKLDEAERVAKTALKAHPSDPVLHNLAGVIAAQREGFESAETHFQTAIGLAPKDRAAYENLGHLYQQRASSDPAMRAKALATYQRLLDIAPGNIEGMYRSGVLLALDGQFAESRAMLERVVAAAGPSAPVLLELARTANKLKDNEGALGYLAHARALEPGNATVHFFFGMVCVEQNLVREAYESLKKAVELDPDNPLVNYAMGAVATHRHEPSESLPYFQKYVRLKPDDPRGHFALGAAYFYGNQFEEARAELDRAVRAPETATGAHYFLGRIARQANDLGTARREIEQVLRLNASLADAWAELGLIQTRVNEYALAEQSLQKALAIDPDHYAASVNLATLYARTKDPRADVQAARVATLIEKRDARAQEFLRIIQVVPYVP
jgi:tetratricopeptide (TPR) repeat protein